MFEKMNLTEWKLEDNNNLVGNIKANNPLFKCERYTDLITRDAYKYQILEIGRVNYAYLDNFIINSMNDYYNKINNGTKEEIAYKTNEYNRLYQMWAYLSQAKAQNFPTLNNLYDELIYKLYLLGYKE